MKFRTETKEGENDKTFSNQQQPAGSRPKEQSEDKQPRDPTMTDNHNQSMKRTLPLQTPPTIKAINQSQSKGGGGNACCSQQWAMCLLLRWACRSWACVLAAAPSSVSSGMTPSSCALPASHRMDLCWWQPWWQTKQTNIHGHQEKQYKNMSWIFQMKLANKPTYPISRPKTYLLLIGRTPKSPTLHPRTVCVLDAVDL